MPRDNHPHCMPCFDAIMASDSAAPPRPAHPTGRRRWKCLQCMQRDLCGVNHFPPSALKTIQPHFAYLLSRPSPIQLQRRLQQQQTAPRPSCRRAVLPPCPRRKTRLRAQCGKDSQRHSASKSTRKPPFYDDLFFNYVSDLIQHRVCKVRGVNNMRRLYLIGQLSPSCPPAREKARSIK